MKNLCKDRVRVPIVNKVKAVVFGFHLPSTVSRVTNIKIGRSWWKARWTTTSRWAKTRQHCRLTICMKLVELTNSHTSYLSQKPREFSCKFFLSGVNFYRLNAKNWQFTVYFVVIYAFFWCNFNSPKILCVKIMTNMRYGDSIR